MLLSLSVTTWPASIAVAVVTVGLATIIFAVLAFARAALNIYARSRQPYDRYFRHEDWAAYEPLNITETVATVAAAAVAVRHMKFLDEASAAIAKNKEVTLDFADLRRIVRRMTASIRSGEAKALRNKRIAWIHRENGEDDLEYNVLCSLGAQVELYLNNEELLDALDGRNEYDLIVTNKGHFISAKDMRSSAGHDPRAGELLLQALRAKRVTCPVIIYSRSLNDADRERFNRLHVFSAVTYPEDFIHNVLQAADDLRRDERNRIAYNDSQASTTGEIAVHAARGT